MKRLLNDYPISLQKTKKGIVFKWQSGRKGRPLSMNDEAEKLAICFLTRDMLERSERIESQRARLEAIKAGY